MMKSLRPKPNKGDSIAGCLFLREYKGGKTGNVTMWSLQCGNCGKIFERIASQHWYKHQQGKDKLCSSKCKRGVSDNEYKKRLARFGKLEALEKYKGRRNKILHRCIKHGNTKLISPDSALQGSGIAECCGLEAIASELRKSTEYFIKKSQRNSWRFI